MVLRTIYPLTPDDMMEFLSLLPSQNIKSITLNLYNGTSSRIKELPSGGYLTMTELTLESESIEMMMNDLSHVEFNQIQRCSVYLKNDKDATTIDLSLLELELKLKESPELYSLDKILQFARTKGIHKLTMRF